MPTDGRSYARCASVMLMCKEVTKLPLIVSLMTDAHNLVFSTDEGNIPGEEFTSNSHGV